MSHAAEPDPMNEADSMRETPRQRAAERWEKRFEELETYVRIFGHGRISNADAARSKLRRWLKVQQAMAVSGEFGQVAPS